MEQNLPAIKPLDEEWPNEDYKSYLMRCMQYQYALHDQKKYTAAFKILNKALFKTSFIENNGVCDDPTTWQDLNIFCGQKNVSVYLASIIDRTSTAFGRAMLYIMLVNPTTSIETLEHRQEIIRYLLEHPELLEKLDRQLHVLKESENMVLSFWCDDPIRNEVRDRYLQWPIKSLNNFVNKSKTLLSMFNAWGHIERCLYIRDYILGAFFVTMHNIFLLGNYASPSYVEKMSSWLQFERGINCGPMLSECLPRIENTMGKNILGLFAGFYAMMNIQETVLWARDQLYLDECLHTKIMHVAKCVESINQLHAMMVNNKDLSSKLLLASSLNIMPNAKKKNNTDMLQLIDLLTHPSFKEKHSVLKDKGRTLISFKFMNENKASFEDVFAALGELDMYVSLAKLFKEHENQRAPYCFAQYIQADRPVFEIKDFWNHFVDPKKVVVNSLSLGMSDVLRNIIITGPNAGGKSTLIKAFAIDVLMAQSFGIAPAKYMAFTPFSKIITYMNIRDDIAAGNSLFKAQVLRAQELLELVQSVEKNKFCFVIIDEMFNGTSPREAEASAYSVAKNIGQHINTICLIATHYNLLTKLEKETKIFSNYSVQVEQSSEGTIIYPFKLKPGISHQYIALDILKAQGINNSILEGAHAIINTNARR